MNSFPRRRTSSSRALTVSVSRVSVFVGTAITVTKAFVSWDSAYLRQLLYVLEYLETTTHY
jgi:hypothetical protein